MNVVKTISSMSPSRMLGGKFVSKWIVLVIDLMLISFTLLIAFTIPKFQLSEISFSVYYRSLITVSFFALIGHLIYKPHQGIIRHTTIYDIKVLFYARSLSFVLNLVFILLLAKPLGLMAYAAPLSVSVINYFLSLYLLAQFRLGIRFIFNQGKRAARDKPKVIIYGSGESGQLTYDALSPVADVIAFIDDNPSLAGKFFKGAKILGPTDDLKHIIEKNNVKQIVISIQNISRAKKRQIADRCLAYGLQVRVVPPFERWVDGALTSSQIQNVKIEELLGRDVITLDKTTIEKEISNQTILITGAAGSIGSEITRQVLRYKPSLLILLDNAESPLHALEMEMDNLTFNRKIDVKTIIADIRDEKTLRHAFENYSFDLIFHAAAYKHVPAMEQHPFQAISVNTLGTQLLADLANEFSVKKMVFVSTDKAVNPTNVMGASKRAAEMYIQSKGRISNTAYITTRFGNVLGSNGSVIPIFKKQIEEGGPVTVTHPEVTRYFMTIPEACQLVLDAGVMGKGGEIFVFDMGESVKVIDLAKKMIQLSGLTPGLDIEIRITGLRSGEKLYEELLSNKEKIIPTHHEKIMKAKVMEHDYNIIISKFNQLSQLMLNSNDAMLLVKTLKELVPEFKSNNSIYESIDNSEAKQNKRTLTDASLS